MGSVPVIIPTAALALGAMVVVMGRSLAGTTTTVSLGFYGRREATKPRVISIIQMGGRKPAND